jgi:hypothetical protein
VSNAGRNSVSSIDAVKLKKLVRIPVGKVPKRIIATEERDHQKASPPSRLLPHDPADGVLLQLDVFRVPQIAEHMAGRHVADAALTVVVRPASRSGSSAVTLPDLPTGNSFQFSSSLKPAYVTLPRPEVCRLRRIGMTVQLFPRGCDTTRALIY